MTSNPFERVLVANRGEIAVRIIRACTELGIDTVAIYSDADEQAEHVRLADEAYHVGPSRAAESYLDQDTILGVAATADADAIHPGYGFLAENAGFAGRVEETDDLTWVGPSAAAMRRLGEKTNARRAMAEVDVPIVPGTTEPVTDPAAVESFGAEHGYPVAIKADGGGGGRGMKVVESADEAADKLESARREGEAYFDNDAVYLERYLENPRHVEVQILADKHGSVRHLGERDCTVQRRHQKLIEEGPSPALAPELRERIRNAARRGVTAVDYANAGTVEFLVADDPDREGVLGPETDFYFLEVNTRIQVEHPVTEALTGIDLVKQQLRVAAGDPLSFSQDDVTIDGHAIEFRITAENPVADFQPASSGTFQTYRPPEGIGIRVDDGVEQGATLITDYDSLIAKVIVWGRDRAECIERSRRALGEYEIDGVETILPLHRLVLADPTFIEGNHTTSYLDEALERERIETAVERWGTDGTMDEPADESTRHEFVVELDGRRHELAIFGDGALAGVLEGAPQEPESTAGESDSATDSSGAGSRTSGSQATGTETDRNSPTRPSSSDGRTASGAGSTETVTAEMQGTVLSVEVDVGEQIQAGDVICVLEAMKMENDIVSARAGTVNAVPISEGDSVGMHDPLLTIEEPDE